MLARVVQDQPKVMRRLRNPQHPFNVEHKPWSIQPFFIAPVLPGESMKDIRFKSRAVTDPVKEPLIGWWLEHYFFYVPLRDLHIRQNVENMVLSGEDLAQTIGNNGENRVTFAQGGRLYTSNYGGTSLTFEALKRVTEEFFRDEGDLWNKHVDSDGLPMTSISRDDFLDSILSDLAALPTDNDAVGEDQDPLVETEYQIAFNKMKAMRFIGRDVTFEDFLKTFGVNVGQDAEPKNVPVVGGGSIVNGPELIRYVRDFQLPSNTVVPTTGAVNSALSWSVSERAGKTRYFKEPGVVLGVSVTRPKVYYKNQWGSTVNFLTRVQDWMPALLWDNPETSLKKFEPAAPGQAQSGPLGNVPSAAYWLDLRDLFIRGEQFVTNSQNKPAATVNLPSPALEKRYAPVADVGELFVDPAKCTVRQDGVVSMSVLSTLTDQT
jgi:hypothetical protein